MNRMTLERVSKQSLAFLLAVIVFMFAVAPQRVYAAATSPQSADSIGTSLYDVSTALSAYVNSVVGSNTNDKHADHKILELSGTNAGVAGCLVGYGDAKKGFYPYIASSNSKSVTTSSYDGWLNVGDNGHTYEYVRYGYLLNDLGLDDTAIEGDDGWRPVFGGIMQFCGVVSSAVPKVFEMCLDLLDTLNPFAFIDIGTGVLDSATDNAFGQHTSEAEWDQMFEDIENGNPIHHQNAGSALDVHRIDSNSALYPVAKELSKIYLQMQDMGIMVVLPMLLVFVLWTVLMTKHGNKGRVVMTWIQRLAFCAIGIPILAVLYTTALNELQTVTTKAPAQVQMIGSTFVDFQSWVDHGRLAPPNGISLVSNGAGSGDNQGNAVSGFADSKTVRTLRHTVYEINMKSGVVAGPNPLGKTGSDTDYMKTGAWNTDEDGKTQIQTDADLSFDNNAVKQSIYLLGKYQKSARYAPAAWETAVNGIFSSESGYQSELGHTSATDNADSNKNTIYGMWANTDNSTDWLDRSSDDNKCIFTGTSYSNGGEWAAKAWNIFKNGTLTGNIDSEKLRKGKGNTSDITFTTSEDWNSGNNAIDPAKPGGLSTVAMYNYLCSEFTDSAINVYSSVNSSSNYVKASHYAVNLIGDGFLRAAYAVNCFAVLIVLSMIGLVYGLGMCFSNLKRGIKLIAAIPLALVGVLRSIVQVIVFVIAMIMELLGTIFLYSVAADLLMTFATVIEQPLKDALATGIIGGQLASISGLNIPVEMLYDSRMVFVLGLILVTLVVGVGSYGAYRIRRPVLVVYEYAWCKLYRRLTCAEMKPAFDAWMAERPSLYVWDFSMSAVKVSLKDVWAGLPDLPASGMNHVQKGVVMS